MNHFFADDCMMILFITPLGPSDRFASVIKSHVRRYLNEKHDVTNAEQFVEACQSYGGVKYVNVVECRFRQQHGTAKFRFEKVKRFRNFIFQRDGIRAHRAWNIGEGLLFSYANLIEGVSNSRLSLRFRLDRARL